MELFLFMIHSTNTQRASATCLALVWVPGRQRRAERRLCFPTAHFLERAAENGKTGYSLEWSRRPEP